MKPHRIIATVRRAAGLRSFLGGGGSTSSFPLGYPDIARYHFAFDVVCSQPLQVRQVGLVDSASDIFPGKHRAIECCYAGIKLADRRYEIWESLKYNQVCADSCRD